MGGCCYQGIELSTITLLIVDSRRRRNALTEVLGADTDAPPLLEDKRRNFMLTSSSSSSGGLLVAVSVVVVVLSGENVGEFSINLNYIGFPG